MAVVDVSSSVCQAQVRCAVLFYLLFSSALMRVWLTFLESVVFMYTRWAFDAHPPKRCTSSSVLPEAYATVAAAFLIACSVYGVRTPCTACASFHAFAIYGIVIVPPSPGNTRRGWSGCVVGASPTIALYARTGQNAPVGMGASTTSRDWLFACRFFAHFLCSLSWPASTFTSRRVVWRVGSNVFIDLGATSDCLAPV